MDLKDRALEGELMDAPGLEVEPHVQALRGLERVNLFSGTASVIARAIVQHWRASAGRQRPAEAGHDRLAPPQPLRILDLACGGGDVTLAVAQRLWAAGWEADVEGWDRSRTAVDYATRRWKELAARGRPPARGEIRFVQREVEQLDDEPRFDVVICTLFLHHLDRPQAIECLKKMFRAARSLVLVDDLRRTQLGYRLAQLGCWALSRSPIVHVDGPLSVRAAFTEQELRALSREADLPAPEFSLHWPQRFLMRWDRTL
jgi:2-polyprenyl-3-methyl-5-hydroxy-6-metoxy-1,4-benzoquinol methylase